MKYDLQAKQTFLEGLNALNQRGGLELKDSAYLLNLANDLSKDIEADVKKQKELDSIKKVVKKVNKNAKNGK